MCDQEYYENKNSNSDLAQTFVYLGDRHWRCKQYWKGNFISYTTFYIAYYKHKYLITLSYLENHTPDGFTKTLDKAENYIQQIHKNMCFVWVTKV